MVDRSAKRRRFNGITDDGITFRSLLAKAAEGASDAKGFEEKARQLSLGLEVYKAFREKITGNPVQHGRCGCYSQVHTRKRCCQHQESCCKRPAQLLQCSA